MIGKLYYSPTGYYSANIAIDDAKLKPNPSCHPFPIRRDPSMTAILKELRIYRACIEVDYGGKSHVTVKVWKDRNPQLSLGPWQAYVDYILTGDRDGVWFGCRKGFEMKDISQLPKSSSGILDLQPGMAGASLQDFNAKNTITFTCQTSPDAK